MLEMDVIEVLCAIDSSVSELLTPSMLWCVLDMVGQRRQHHPICLAPQPPSAVRRCTQNIIDQRFSLLYLIIKLIQPLVALH